MDYRKIENIYSKKGLSLTGLAKKIEMSPSGLYRSIENETLQVKVLEKIADVLEVPVTVFFEEDHIDNKTARILQSENEFLKRTINTLYDQYWNFELNLTDDENKALNEVDKFHQFRMIIVRLLLEAMFETANDDIQKEKVRKLIQVVGSRELFQNDQNATTKKKKLNYTISRTHFPKWMFSRKAHEAGFVEKDGFFIYLNPKSVTMFNNPDALRSKFKNKEQVPHKEEPVFSFSGLSDLIKNDAEDVHIEKTDQEYLLHFSYKGSQATVKIHADNLSDPDIAEIIKYKSLKISEKQKQ